jgi:hypothetical protein
MYALIISRDEKHAVTGIPVEALRYEYLIKIGDGIDGLLRLPLCGILAMTGELNYFLSHCFVRQPADEAILKEYAKLTYRII